MGRLAKLCFALFKSKYNVFFLQIVKGTFYLLDTFCTYMGIYFAGFAAFMKVNSKAIDDYDINILNK